MCRILLCFLFFIEILCSDIENLHRRHEYQFTFKGPVITPPNSNEIPFFDIGGHVITGKDRVRLTASLPNQQGWIWSKNKSSFPGFEIDLVFKISGNGRMGADGLALWVVQSTSAGGPALGASASWQGLGIFFDTYDSQGRGKSPAVIGIVNNGAKFYSPETDGKDISVGHCVRELRNMPYSIRSRVTYFNNALVVTMSPGLSKDHDEMEECFRVNVEIPKSDYYFGLTSSTGILADDHDVEKMEVHSLWEKQNVEAEEEKKKMEEQKRYEEEYQHKLDNIAKTEPTEEKSKEDLGDIGVRQNLMAIWQEIAGQHQSLRSLMKSVSLIQAGLSSSDKSALPYQMDALRKDVLEVKNNVEMVSRKIENTGNAYPNQQAFMQIHSSVDALKSDLMRVFEKISTIQQTVGHIKDNSETKVVGDNCGSCLSLPIMIILGSLQSAFIIGFMIYQKTRDNAAKKFY